MSECDEKKRLAEIGNIFGAFINCSYMCPGICLFVLFLFFAFAFCFVVLLLFVA